MNLLRLSLFLIVIIIINLSNVSADERTKTNIIKSAVGVVPEVLPQVATKSNGIAAAKALHSGGLTILKTLPAQVQKFGRAMIEAVKKIINAAKQFVKGLIQKAVTFVANIVSKIAVKTASLSLFAVGSVVALATSMATVALAALTTVLMVFDFADVGGYNKMASNTQYAKMKKQADDDFKQMLKEAGVAAPMVMGPLNKIKPEDVEKAVSDRMSQLLSDEKSPFAQQAVEEYKKLLAQQNQVQLTKRNLFQQTSVDTSQAVQPAPAPLQQFQQSSPGNNLIPQSQAVQLHQQPILSSQNMQQQPLSPQQHQAHLSSQIIQQQSAVPDHNVQQQNTPSDQTPQQHIPQQVQSHDDEVTQQAQSSDLQPKQTGHTTMDQEVEQPLSQEESVQEHLWTQALQRVDMEKLQIEALSQVCVEAGGKMVNGTCSYKDQQTCDSSYTWPNPKETDYYVEWKDDLGACVAASMAMRVLCESDNGPGYDYKTGWCKITPEYCAMKGAEWKIDGETGVGECYVPLGQTIMEALFSTTLVRGLKQIFDPKQYERCKEGEKDDVYTCRAVSCPEDLEYDAGVCYPKCPEGYQGLGIHCYKTCPSGYRPFVTTCQGQFCPEGFSDLQNSICYEPCQEGYNNVANWCWGGCPANSTDGGAMCLSCDSDWELNGATCYPKCKPGFKPWGLVQCTEESCPEGWRDDGITCSKIGCNEDEENINGLCYSKCEQGYSSDGVTMCYQDCPEGWTNDGLTCRKVECPPDKPEHMTGLCYSKCPAGFKGSALSPTDCYSECAPGENEVGVTCNKYSCPEGWQELSAGVCYPPCEDGFEPVPGVPTLCREAKCPEGYHEDIPGGPTCSKQACPASHPDKRGARCYEACPEGFSNNGQILDKCYQNKCDEGFKESLYHCTKTACADGLVYENGLCYEACPPNYTSDGALLCYENCPAGSFATTPQLCQAEKCDEGEEETTAGLCYPKCKEGYAPVPGVPTQCRQVNCPSGYQDDGATCRRDPHTFWRSREAGWNANCHDDEEKVCRGICGHSFVACKKKCPEGYRTHPDSCTRDAHIVGKDSYHRGAGKPKVKVTTRKSHKRNVGKAVETISVHKKVHHRGNGVVLELGTHNKKTKHRNGVPKKLHVSGRKRHHRGAGVAPVVSVKGRHGKSRGVGRSNIQVRSKQTYGRGAGKPAYSKTKHSYQRKSRPAKTHVFGRESITRGVARKVASVHVRGKKRIVPFSTKNN